MGSATAGMAWRATHRIDAKGQVLGRVSTQVASLLMGKHKPTYDPAKLCGDKVVVENVKDIVLTGNKLKQKLYRYHTGYAGGLKEKQAKDVLANTPERVLQ